MKKAPNEVDHNVGARIRVRRQMLGMSQEALGTALGITFQQVQKYEKGTNRVSASRLQMIGDTLGVDVGYFYEGQRARENAGGFAEEGAASYDAGLFATAESVKLVKAFTAIKDPTVRRRLLDLAQALSGQE